MVNKYNDNHHIPNSCGGNTKSVNAGSYDARTHVSKINFHLTLKHLCKHSKYGLCVEVYFTPKCGERYLAGVVTKAIDVDEYCNAYKYSDCCDEIVVYFKDVVVNVASCNDGCFDVEVHGNYLEFEECKEWDKYYDCYQCDESEEPHNYEQLEEIHG